MAAKQQATRGYVTMRLAEDMEGLGREFWELLGIEEAANPDEARAAARARFPEGQQSGVVVAIAEGSFKPKAGGRRQVWVDDESDHPITAPRATAPAKDSSGKVPLPGQTDLPAVGVPVDGTPAWEPGDPVKDGEPVEVPPVVPIPHEIVPDPPAVSDEEIAAAKAARDERVRENARRYAEAQAAGEAAQAPARAAAAEAVDRRTSAEVAENLIAKEAARKAAEQAKRDEPPAPVNPVDDGWGSPGDDGEF